MCMYKKITLNEVPKRQRKALSRFETTEEWRMMKADLDKGLKPLEAIQVSLTEEDKRRYRIQNRVTISRFIKKYLVANGLKYHVKTFRRDDYDFIVVMNISRLKRGGLG